MVPTHRRPVHAFRALVPHGFLSTSLVAFILWMTVSTPAGAQERLSSPADTLVIASFEALMQAVEQNSAELAALESRAAALTEQVATKGTLPDPTIMLGASPLPVHTARGEQILHLRVEQMLPWPAKRKLQRDMAGWEAKAASEDVRRVRAERTLEAVHAALAARRAEQLEDEVRSFSERLNRFEQVALTRYETGQGDQQSIWKLQLAIAAQDQRLIQLEGDRGAAVARISEIVNRPVSVPGRSFTAPAPIVATLAAAGRAEFRRLQDQLERSMLAREVAALANRPDWGLSATWMAMKESDIPPSSDGRDALGLGVMVRIPLGRTEQRAREETERLKQEALRHQMKAFESSLAGLWEEQLVRLEGLMERLDHLDTRLLSVAESMLESSFQSYSTGTSGFLDLLDAERTAFDLRMQRVDLITQIDMARWVQQRLAGHLESPSDHSLTR